MVIAYPPGDFDLYAEDKAQHIRRVVVCDAVVGAGGVVAVVSRDRGIVDIQVLAANHAVIHRIHPECGADAWLLRDEQLVNEERIIFVLRRLSVVVPAEHKHDA